jgi:L-amino acid N-acyltransferase YncA
VNPSARNVAIRPVEPRDLAAVAGIYARYVETSTATFELEPPTVAEWHARLEAISWCGLPFLVAETAGGIAGYAYCSPWRTRPAYRRTVEDSVYVDAGTTGRGIGRALLGELLTACADAGVREIIAVVTEGHAGSLALHQRHGFTIAGRLTRVGHKHGQWLDTLLLQRSLRP